MKSTKKKIEWVEIFSAYTVLGQRDLAVWYSIAKNIQTLKKVVQDYNEMKDAIVDKYAIKDDNGKPKIKPDDTYEFGDKLKVAQDALEVLNKEELEVELETFAHEKIKDDKLPAAVLASIMEFITA